MIIVSAIVFAMFPREPSTTFPSAVAVAAPQSVLTPVRISVNGGVSGRTTSALIVRGGRGAGVTGSSGVVGSPRAATPNDTSGMASGAGSVGRGEQSSTPGSPTAP